MSKKSDFSKTLEDLDQKVSEIKSQQKVVTEKEKRIQKIVNEQELKLKELQILEAKVAKKAELQNKIMYMVILSLVGIIVLVPIYRKDPVNFWFYVIVVICSLGTVAIKKNKGG